MKKKRYKNKYGLMADIATLLAFLIMIFSLALDKSYIPFIGLSTLSLVMLAFYLKVKEFN